MGILEIHFHDSDFSWTVNPRGSDEKTLSFGSDESSKSASKAKSSSGGSRSATATGGGSGARKLWMVGALALFVGAGVGFSKLRSRRRTDAPKSERESSGRRLSLSRSK